MKKEFQVGHYALNEAGAAMTIEESTTEFKDLWSNGYGIYVFVRAVAATVHNYDKETDIKGVCNNWFSNHTKTFFYESSTQVMSKYFDQICQPELPISSADFQIALSSILDWSTYVVPEIIKISERKDRKLIRYFYRHIKEMSCRANFFNMAIMFGMEKLGYKTLKEMEDINT